MRRLAARRLTRNEEKRATFIAKHLMRALFLLKPKLVDFLRSWGLPQWKGEDASKIMKRIIDYIREIPHIMSTTRYSVEENIAIIRKAIFGRNKTCHGELPVVLREWKPILRAWIRLSYLIGANSLVKRLRKMMRTLGTANPPKPYTVSFETIFMSVFSERTDKWTEAKRCAAIAIGHVLYDAFLGDVADCARNFIDSNSIRANWTSEMDFYEYGNLILDQCCVDDFVVPPGTADETDLFQKLKRVMDGRNAVSHDQYRNIFYNWERYLNDAVYFLIAIRCPVAASRVQSRLDQLFAAKAKAETQMTAVNNQIPLSRFSRKRKTSPCLNKRIRSQLRRRLKRRVRKILQ